MDGDEVMEAPQPSLQSHETKYGDAAAEDQIYEYLEEEEIQVEAVQEEDSRPKKPTKAEKKRLAKLLALQLRRAVAEKQRQIVRDFLIREQKYGRINRKQIEKRLRKILISIKTPDQRRELTYLVNNIERLFDAKDFKISLLMDECDKAYLQSSLNNRSHLQTFEDLVLVFRTQLDHLKDKYDSDLSLIKNDCGNSLVFLNKRKCFNEEFLNMMLYGLSYENKHEIKNMRSDFMSKISGETSWYNIAMNNKKIDYISTFERNYKEYTEVFSNFINTNEETKKAYEIIRKRDSQILESLNKYSGKILESYDTIKRLKEAHEAIESEFSCIENDITSEKSSYSEAFNILKNRLIINEKKDRQKLVELTQNSTDIISYLRVIKEKGDKIVKMMSLCYKYETEMEKVMPFPKLMATSGKSSTYFIENSFFPPMISADRFWQKMAVADASRHLLKEELQGLKKEEANLKSRIQKYCNRAACRCLLPTVHKVKMENKIKPVVKVEKTKNNLPISHSLKLIHWDSNKNK